MVKKKVKLIETKSINERIQQVVILRKKLLSLGITDNVEGIKLFNDISNQYVKDGGNYSGKIKLVGCKRVLDYILSDKKTGECKMNLLYNEDI